MRSIGFLGCGKIGQALLTHCIERGDVEVVFIQDQQKSFFSGAACPVIKEADADLYTSADIIVECATAEVIKENYELILRHSDLLAFSLTAFSDASFMEAAMKVCEESGHKIYIPHGAILGLDGIFDGRKVWDKVSVVTTKSPKSLGRTDAERTIVYEGPTRKVCTMYPRNVNVHAAIALAGIGFDKTQSTIISDPSVSTNAYTIHLVGEGMDITLNISSYAAGSVTGAYTPYSACGSLDRILGGGVLQLV